MKIIRALVIGLMVLHFVKPAIAAMEAGNGGQGVRMGERLVLLDLLEAGVEDDPQVSRLPANDPELLARLEAPFHDFKAVLPLLASKLEEVRRESPALANSLILAAEAYSWNLINASLEPLPDHRGTLDPDANQIVQLAVRIGRSVRIAAAPWSQLDEKHRAALIFHELIYALMPIRIRERGEAPSQSAVRARELVGYFFSRRFTEKASENLSAVVGNDLYLGSDRRQLVEKDRVSVSVDFSSESGEGLTTEVVRFRSVLINKGTYPFVDGLLFEGCSRGLSSIGVDPETLKRRHFKVTLTRIVRDNDVKFSEFESPRGPQVGLRTIDCADSHCEYRVPFWEIAYREPSGVLDCLSSVRNAAVSTFLP